MLKLEHVEVVEFLDIFLLRLFFEAHFIDKSNEMTTRKYAAEIKIFRKVDLSGLAHVFHRLAFLLESKFPMNSSDPEDCKWLDVKEW